MRMQKLSNNVDIELGAIKFTTIHLINDNTIWTNGTQAWETFDSWTVMDSLFASTQLYVHVKLKDFTINSPNE